ncbi:MAG: hypothetical protein IT258_23745 [Saprospiraceae bacterium]|nr:hypothetical protein [Saprospiraceae bacterium]
MKNMTEIHSVDNQCFETKIWGVVASFFSGKYFAMIAMNAINDILGF